MKIKLYVNTGFAGEGHSETVDVDDEFWNAMSKDEQEAFLDESAKECMFECIEFGAFAIDSDE